MCDISALRFRPKGRFERTAEVRDRLGFQQNLTRHQTVSRIANNRWSIKAKTCAFPTGTHNPEQPPTTDYGLNLN